MLLAEIADLDSLVSTCFFYTSERPNGAPDTSNNSRWHGINISGIGSSLQYRNQLACAIGDTKWYARGMASGMWSGWVEL